MIEIADIDYSVFEPVDPSDSDEWIDPVEVPTIVETAEAPIRLTVDVVRDYQLVPYIAWDSVARDKYLGTPLFAEGDLLTDYLDWAAVEPVYGDPADPRDRIISNFIHFAWNDEHDFYEHDYLRVTLGPEDLTEVRIDLDAWRAAALGSGSDSDTALVELLDSLTGDREVNLLSLLRRLPSMGPVGNYVGDLISDIIKEEHQ